MIKIFKKSLFLLFVLFFILSFSKILFADSQNFYYYDDNCLECLDLEEDINKFCEKNNIEKIELINDSLVNLKKHLADINYNGKIKMPLLIYDGEVYVGEEVSNFIKESTSSSFLLLGFLDGFNPCAISILMIFSSFLITIDKKKNLFFIGLSFILGESLSNFLLGFGLFTITNYISNFRFFSNIVYIVSLFICLYVVYINTIDIFNFFRKKEEIRNMLSLNVRYKINEVLSKTIASKFLILFSFMAGFIIAILEFGCTGQIYLPTIVYLNELNINIIFNLVLYNIMFAIPLLIFLFLALFLNPSKIQKNVMKYSCFIKIIVNILLIILFAQIIVKLI